MTLNLTVIHSPIGKLGIRTTTTALTHILFLPSNTPCSPPAAYASTVASQLMHYFDCPSFQWDIRLKIAGSPFQETLWRALQNIPVGARKTYKELATLIQSSPRAVGHACRNNPIPIIIPCHRVVAKAGLGGFSGATAGEKIAIKQWLLQHESSHCAESEII